MLFCFDEIVLDTDRRELRRKTEPIAIEPQVFDLLEYLIRNRDRVASRDDLLDAVWHGRIVSESTLSSRINAARTAIGDDGASQRLIRTLPRKGIRFVAEVHEEPSKASRSSPEQSGTAHTLECATVQRLPSIVVLPFDSMSSDPDDNYFADGVTEEIITALSHCSGMTVIARNSAFIYKGRAADIREVGRDLGAGYVLEGSVRRSQDTVRITAQLIDATSGTHLWADRFDAKLENVLELQDRIAETAAGIIEPRMRYAELDRARRSSPEELTAYELRLRAMALAGELTEGSMTEAINTCERALAIEPENALVMATAAYYRAQCHFQGWQMKPRQLADEALKLAWDAVALDNQDANVQWMAAFTVWTFTQDAPRARELFRRSLELNPNNAIAHTLAGWIENANGDPLRGRGLIERAMRLNPQHPRAWFMSAGMATSYIAEKRFNEAIPWAEKAVTQNGRSAVALRALAVALVAAGEMERAKTIVHDMLRIEPQLTTTALQKRLPFTDGALKKVYVDNLRAAGLSD